MKLSRVFTVDRARRWLADSAIDRSDLAASLVAIALAMVLGLALTAPLALAKPKLVAVAAAATAYIVAAYLSGRPRLLCLWALVLTVPLNLSKYLTEFSDRGGGEVALRLEISDVFLGLLLCYLAWELYTGRRSGVRVPKVALLWGAIMMLGAATAIFSTWQRVALFELVRMFKVVMLFVVVCNELTRAGLVRHTIKAMSFAVLVQGIIGLLQYITGGSLGLEKLGETSLETTEVLATTSIQLESVWRVSALLLHPNIFGIFLATLLPQAIGGFLTAEKPRTRAYFLISAAVGMAALIVTFSRSSWVSFTAAFVVLVMLTVAHGELRRRALIPTLLASIALALIVVAFSDRIATRLFQSKEIATVGREEFKKDARRLIAENPGFGAGLNSYVDALLPFSKYSRRTFGYWIPPVHNIYLLWQAELGTVGLILHLAVIGAVAWACIDNLRTRDPTLYTINAACLGAMAAFLVDGAFSFSLRINSILRLFWLLAAVVLAIRYLRLSGDTSNPVAESRGNGGLRGAGMLS